MKEYKIRWKCLRTGEWDEDIIEGRNLFEAQECAKEAYFDTNEVSYTAEELKISSDEAVKADQNDHLFKTMEKTMNDN